MNRYIPCSVKLIFVNNSPRLHQLQLLDWNTACKQFTVYAHRCFIFIVINMKMRLVALTVITVDHFDHDVMESAKLRH